MELFLDYYINHLHIEKEILLIACELECTEYCPLMFPAQATGEFCVRKVFEPPYGD